MLRIPNRKYGFSDRRNNLLMIFSLLSHDCISVMNSPYLSTAKSANDVAPRPDKPPECRRNHTVILVRCYMLLICFSFQVLSCDGVTAVYELVVVGTPGVTGIVGVVGVVVTSISLRTWS